MRILVINPNTSADLTKLVETAGRQVASPEIELVAVTAPRGVPYISSYSEAQIAGAVVLEILAEWHGEVDAAIIAAFGDPGLLGARQLFEIPVVGMAEAAMLTSCMLGRRFSIITFSPALSPWFRECVAFNSMTERFCGIRAVTTPFKTISEVQDELEDALVDLANSAVVEDDAEVIIFSGAPLAALAGKVADRIAVPVVDPMAAAVKQAEALISLKPRKPRAGGFQHELTKQTTGLTAALSRRIEHKA